jgi:archaellum biogenesis protein FlaJ (TadC family)
MKPAVKILLLLLALMVPYMGLVMYFAFRLPQQHFPTWFLYVAPIYFFGSILLAVVLRKRMPDDATQEELQKRKRSAVRAARRMGYIWLMGPVIYILLGGPLREPVWTTVLGLSWAGFLSWASFRIAKKTEKQLGQDSL